MSEKTADVDRGIVEGDKSIADLRQAYGARPGETIPNAILRNTAENAKPLSEYAQKSLDISGREMKRLSTDYDVQPGELFPAAVVRNNEVKLHKEFCGRVDEAVQNGASLQNAYQNLLDHYGFNANTRFSCAPVTSGEQPQNGVTTDARGPSVSWNRMDY